MAYLILNVHTCHPIKKKKKDPVSNRRTVQMHTNSPCMAQKYQQGAIVFLLPGRVEQEFQIISLILMTWLGTQLNKHRKA